MHYSKKHNLLFVRIPKNVSSSMAAYLASNTERVKGDISTGVPEIILPGYNISTEVVDKFQHDNRYMHLTLQEIVDNNVLSKETVLNSYNFGIIRNPLERQLSLFFWIEYIRQDKKDTSPEHFRKRFSNGYDMLMHDGGSNKIKQVDYLKVDGEICGNFWAVQDIQAQLKSLREQHNFSETYPLLRLKDDSKPKDLTKEELIEMYYDSATRQAVEEYYAEDFEMLKKVSLPQGK